MENDSPLPEQPTTNAENTASFGGLKTIQPLNPTIVPEEPAPEPPVPAVVPDENVTEETNTDSEPVTDMYALRTTPLHPATAPATPAVATPASYAPNPYRPQTPATPASETNNSSTFAIIGIRIFGAIMIVLASLSLLSWLKVSSLGAMSIFSILLAAGELLLGVGIMLQKESARTIYIYVAVIMLVFSTYNTVNYLRESQAISNQTTQRAQSAIDAAEQQITYLTNSPSLSQAAKTTAIASAESSIKKENQVIADSKLAPMRSILNLAIAILPLIFLTRPSIKRLFE